MKLILLPVLFLLFLGVATAFDCEQFYDSLNSMSSITANNGVVTGTVNFVNGINNNAARFNASNIKYTNNMFQTNQGTLSLWVRKTSSDVSGGIAQVGEISSYNSLGLFYQNTNNIIFEIKGTGLFNQLWSPAILNQTNFTHVVIVWKGSSNSTIIKMFVNGKYIDGNTLYASYIPTANWLQLGRTGFYGNGDVEVDEVRFFNRTLSDPEIYAEYVYSGLKFNKQPTTKPVSAGSVKIIDNELVVNNQPFKVKGAGYQPVPIGSSNTNATLNYIYSNASILNRDIPLLREMNVNTIRLWHQLNDDTLLDALWNDGIDPIYAIMTFEVPTNYNYSNPANIAMFESEMEDFVNQFKDHPAVLGWAIGNENNLHYTMTPMKDWYLLADKLAQKAYESEGSSYHPTILINGYMKYMGDEDYKSDDANLEYVDLWGHNTYVGYEFNCYFDYYDELTAKPLVFTEYGIDAYNHTANAEYPQVQANWDLHLWDQIEANSLGGTVMAYSDEWWKYQYGNYNIHNSGGYTTDTQPDGYSDEEYWGVMAIQDNGTAPDIMIPRAVYYAFQAAFYEPDTTPPTLIASLNDTALKFGESALVIFNFSEQPLGFTLEDVAGENGLLSGLTSINSHIYVAVFTPAINVEDNTNVITVGLGWTDGAGNPPVGITTSGNYAIDTLRPTITITLSDTVLNLGEAAVITFNFSEQPIGFALNDVIGENGVIYNLTSITSTTYTATFVPNVNIYDETNIIVVSLLWTDVSGNSPANISTSGNYVVDTRYSCGDVLIESTVLYYDIEDCLEGLVISEPDLILNCDGHTISGTGIGTGINVLSSDNVEIFNCSVHDFEKGLNLYDASSGSIHDNLLSENNYGAYLENSEENIFMNNYFDNVINAHAEDNNYWDNGVRGNLWMDLNNNPGFPKYHIQGQGIDNHPLNVNWDVFFLGDVDGNDEITMDDSCSVFQWAYGQGSYDEWQFWSGDVINDDSLTTQDAYLIAQYALGYVESFNTAASAGVGMDVILKYLLADCSLNTSYPPVFEGKPKVSTDTQDNTNTVSEKKHKTVDRVNVNYADVNSVPSQDRAG